MAHLIRDESHRIELDDGEWVDVKRRLSIGDLEEIEAAAGDIGRGIAGGRAMLTNLIKAWSFQEDDQPVPVTPENVSRLSAETAAVILGEVNRLNPVRSSEQTENLSLPSSGTSGSPRRSRRRARPE